MDSALLQSLEAQNLKRVERFLEQRGAAFTLRVFDGSSATVSLAANQLGVTDGQIAKTMAIKAKKDILLIVCAGDKRLDSRKFKDRFENKKPTFLKEEELLAELSYAPGGVCPFDVKHPVYLDVSLCDYDILYPAAGSHNSCVEISRKDLELLFGSDYIDVCK